METPETQEAGDKPLTISGIDTAREMHRKFFVPETKTLKNGDIEAYVSTEAIDRVGDIIKAKGWELENYKKTGSPVLFGHDYNQPPIGKAIEIEVQRKGLWSITRFHEKTQMSRDLAMLARDKDMNSWSVGFNPLEAPETRTEGGVFKGYIFNKQELLEYSLVPVPANPEAVSKAVSLAAKGMISEQLRDIIRTSAAIYARPSPLADEGSSTDEPNEALLAAQAQDEHEAIMAGLHFLKGYVNGKTG